MPQTNLVQPLTGNQYNDQEQFMNLSNPVTGNQYNDQEQFMIEQIAESTGRTAVDTAADVEELLKDVPDCDRQAALEAIYNNSGSLDDDDLPSCGNCKFEDKCPLRSLLDRVSECFQFMVTEDWTPDAGEFCKCHEYGDEDPEDDDNDDSSDD